MVLCVDIATKFGQIWETQPSSDDRGIFSVIQALKDRTSITIAVFNASGTEFAVADSQGRITIFHVEHNRYKLGICILFMLTS